MKTRMTQKHVTRIEAIVTETVHSKATGEPLWLLRFVVVELKLDLNNPTRPPQVAIKARAKRYRKGKIRANAAVEWEFQIDIYIEDLVYSIVEAATEDKEILSHVKNHYQRVKEEIF